MSSALIIGVGVGLAALVMANRHQPSPVADGDFKDVDGKGNAINVRPSEVGPVIESPGGKAGVQDSTTTKFGAGTMSSDPASQSKPSPAVAAALENKPAPTPSKAYSGFSSYQLSKAASEVTRAWGGLSIW